MDRIEVEYPYIVAVYQSEHVVHLVDWGSIVVRDSEGRVLLRIPFYPRLLRRLVEFLKRFIGSEI